MSFNEENKNDFVRVVEHAVMNEEAFNAFLKISKMPTTTLDEIYEVMADFEHCWVGSLDGENVIDLLREEIKSSVEQSDHPISTYVDYLDVESIVSSHTPERLLEEFLSEMYSFHHGHVFKL